LIPAVIEIRAEPYINIIRHQKAYPWIEVKTKVIPLRVFVEYLSGIKMKIDIPLKAYSASFEVLPDVFGCNNTGNTNHKKGYK